MTTNIESKINLQEVNNLIASNICEILDKLNIYYVDFGNRVSIKCPYHLGTKDTSFSIYKDVGNVVCWTRHCEENHGKWILNVISHTLKLNITETIFWVENLLNKKISTIEINNEIDSFNKFVSSLNKKVSKKTGISREYVRKSLEIPSVRFIKRGFSEKVLNDYDVGFCNSKEKEMFLRDTVPVYNEDCMAIGAMGRTIYKQCPICSTYHNSNRLCPRSDIISNRLSSKWINSKGFSTGSYFYNWNVAKSIINQTNSVFIVEGCGDCFKLIESGIINCLGLFGCKMTIEQQLMLESLKLKNVYLCLDNDEPGKSGTEKILKQIKRYYNVSIITPTMHDWGDMTVNSIQNIMRGFI